MARDQIAAEAVPVPVALGWALPALQLPRDSGYFLSIRDKELEQSRRWKKLFEKLVSDRKPLMVKQRPNRQIIEAEELQSHFKDVQEDIPAKVHPAIQAFIDAPPGWGVAAEDLAQFEWESESVLQVFSGIKLKKTTLPQETIYFFEDTLPGRLSASDADYLETLKARSLKETRDDDREFFETYRNELGQDKALRVKWERFVFGRPIECTDFLEGMLRAIERLFGQVNVAPGKRTLTIRSARRSRSQWLDINADVGLAFGVRYRGLRSLMGAQVEWDTPYLFAYEEVLDRAKKRKKYRRNESTSRSRPPQKRRLLRSSRHLRQSKHRQLHQCRSTQAKQLPRMSRQGFHTWTIEQVRQFEAFYPVGTKERLAMSLLFFLGVRRSDVVRLGPPMETQGGSRIRFTEMKGRDRKLKQHELMILPQLRSVLDNSSLGHDTYLVTAFGRPWVKESFSNWFSEACERAGLPMCSAHGLRKAGATIAAENGATEMELMAIFGWSSPQQAAVYTRKANRARLADRAIHLLIPEQSGDNSGQKKNDFVAPHQTGATKTRKKAKASNG